MKKQPDYYSISAFLNFTIFLFFFFTNNSILSAQEILQYDEKLYNSIEWRNIGPYRGGRSCAVSGVPGKPNLFYFGATGGGVWKTTDGGRSWENISDGFFGGSIGSIAVSEYDNNVIYAGGGEKTVRGNVSSGYGIYKTTDAGKTWQKMGLEQSRHISRIRIHPRNHDIVYAACMGNLYAANEQRGVFKSSDGGTSWKKVLYANDEVGAVDLCLDPNNPRIIYATTWRVKRTPYNLSSGGPGSAIYKSTDGGETWTNITENEGLPKGTLGIIGISVSPVNSERVWAIIESEEGGVFRSDDAGKTWKKLNGDRDLRQRAWYYTRIYADPLDKDVVYVLNVQYHKSKDGGKTFDSINTPHSDHHDLWIAPENPNRMIIADDGGAQITYDGGTTWSTYHNQPTAQFYRLTTDNHFPYRIYAAQQDNSTIRISNRSSGNSIDENDWEETAGCECGHIAIDPLNNDIVYGGCYGGLLQRLDHKTKLSRLINVWPDNPMGHGAEGTKYRFQWNFPIFFSPHDPNKMYAASNHLHVTYDEGQSWETISPDLTRNDSTKLGPSGGPITKDNTSAEYYCTIFAAAESPLTKDLIWLGSDDGLIHLTHDGGRNWKNVTPTDMPEWIMINSIEANPFLDGGAYVAATMYKSGDFKPYLFKTEDYGMTWTKITDGINDEHFTRVIRADPLRRGLLFAGTESGMYISFDDGKSWQSFQLNLPIVPVTDLAVKYDNLIATTQGRSIWLIDDLTVLRQLHSSIGEKRAHLYKPMPSFRMDGSQNKEIKHAGTNHPGGVMIHYYLKEYTDSMKVKIEILDADSVLIREFSNSDKNKEKALKVKQGANLFDWDMTYPDAEKFDKMIFWWGSLNGPKAIPGNYKVKLTVDTMEQIQDFKILQDLRSTSTVEEIKAQFEFISEIIEKLTVSHKAISNIRDVKQQLKNYTNRLAQNDEMKPIHDAATAIDSSLTAIEEALYQTKNESSQDPLNYPIKLTNKLAHLNSLMRIGDYPPTDQAIAVKKELTGQIDQYLDQYESILKNEIPAFNQLVKQKNVGAIILKEE